MPRRSSLWLRLAWPVLAFVVAGSLALAFWIQASAQRESRAVFATLARTNAEFIRSARLPPNERVAESIGRVLNMQVFFREDSWEMRPDRSSMMRFARGVELVPRPEPPLAQYRPLLENLKASDGIRRAGLQFEIIAAPVEGEGATLLLVRQAEPPFGFFTRPETLLILGGFWTLSVGLAWTLTRGLVRPLRLLAERLPRIEEDSARTLPGADRQDEIGQLARAYLRTRGQLAEERKRREGVERLAILGRMATGLAHEIHNPLSAIRMHAQLIDSSGDEGLLSAARESLPVLLGEAAKIEGLVNQWMFLVRPAPPQTAPADLAALLADVIRALSPQAAHAAVLLVNETTSGLVARVDARRLQQAIGNVLLNAIQALPRGGAVAVRGGHSTALGLAAENSACGSFVWLAFADTGRGFSKEALERHADLFFSEKEGGMGIGLSVTCEILRAHGGSLQVKNARDGGGLVTFQLPAAEPEKHL